MLTSTLGWRPFKKSSSLFPFLSILSRINFLDFPFYFPLYLSACLAEAVFIVFNFILSHDRPIIVNYASLMALKRIAKAGKSVQVYEGAFAATHMDLACNPRI